MIDIKILRTQTPKQKPDFNNLGFGNYFTDHMFLMDYTQGKGWHDARIVPYAPLVLDPAAMVFHYGQEMFEGLKAYRTQEGKIQLFRPEKNIQRMNATNDRLCIPRVNVDDVVQTIRTLVETDKDWVPQITDSSLYIRPFIIATEPKLGVHASNNYIFCTILSPVGAYYAEGINPVKIYIEREYVRAVKGGIGFAKAGGNYASSLIAQSKANSMGYAQVLWLDGLERKYVDEVGTMNVFFVIDGEVLTPELSGSILPGVTRDTCISLLKNWGIKISERKISIDEIVQAHKNSQLEEVFGSGTAAVISPVGELNNDGDIMQINNGKIGPVAQRLYDAITGIQWGRIKDEFAWTLPVC